MFLVSVEAANSPGKAHKWKHKHSPTCKQCAPSAQCVCAACKHTSHMKNITFGEGFDKRVDLSLICSGQHD